MTEQSATLAKPEHLAGSLKQAAKRLYVDLLLALLPLLVKTFCLFSKKAKEETRYLGDGFCLDLRITGHKAHRALRATATTWHASNGDEATLVIAFHDLDYAFKVFSGAITLKDALVAHFFRLTALITWG